MSREHYRIELTKLRGAKYAERLTGIITELGEGDNVNKHGIYTNVETVRLPTKNRVEIGVVKGSDGLWRYRYDWSTTTGGGGTPASVFDKGYESRELALLAGAESILKHWSQKLEPDAKAIEDYIDGLKNEQLSLF